MVQAWVSLVGSGKEAWQHVFFGHPRHLAVVATKPFRLSPALGPRDGRGYTPALMLARFGLPGQRVL